MTIEELKQRRVKFEDAKNMSKEELKKYLKGLYCSFPFYDEFLHDELKDTGVEVEEDEILVCAAVQDNTHYDAKSYANLGLFWNKTFLLVNPIIMRDKIGLYKTNTYDIDGRDMKNEENTYFPEKFCPIIEIAEQEIKYGRGYIFIGKIKIANNYAAASCVPEMLSIEICKECFAWKDKTKFELEYIKCFVSHIPLNLLISGTPCAGKSYLVNETLVPIITHGYEYRCERFVVSDTMSYEDLLGSYRPVADGNRVKYDFVPGPFIRLYMEAVEGWCLKDCEENRGVLILEELSRGDAYNILGDLYLLLDRDEYGFSRYPVSIDNNVTQYLRKYFNKRFKELIGVIDEERKGKILSWLDPEKMNNSIRLLPNFYVIATMNNADAGVSYLDASIRRRFKPVFIDYNGKQYGLGTNNESERKIDKKEVGRLIKRVNIKLKDEGCDMRISPMVFNSVMYPGDTITEMEFITSIVGSITQYAYRNDGEHQSFTKCLMDYENYSGENRKRLEELMKKWDFIKSEGEKQ